MWLEVKLLLRVIFNKIFEWRFDQKRVKKARQVKASRQSESQKKRLDKLLETTYLDFELGLEYDEELINLFYPCHTENIPWQVWDFWNVMQSNIMLAPAGMGGVTFRDSKESTLKLIKRFGYDPIIVAPFIEEYESRLLEEHQSEREND